MQSTRTADDDDLILPQRPPTPRLAAGPWYGLPALFTPTMGAVPLVKPFNLPDASKCIVFKAC
jgi:hypothetical protein